LEKVPAADAKSVHPYKQEGRLTIGLQVANLPHMFVQSDRNKANATGV
jgi:hypothetical protein